MTTESILELGLLATVLSSIWMVFVLSIRTAVARWLGARWAYYLWLIPLLGLLAMGIPNQPVQRMLDIPGIEVPVVNSAIETAQGMLGLADRSIEVKSHQTPSSLVLTTPDLLLITWMLGTLLSLCFFTARSFRFSVKMQHSSRPMTELEKSLVRTRCAGLASRSPAGFRMLSTGRGPAVTGLVKPVLLLPVDFFQRYTTQQQVLMLEHEYQHLRSHDLISLLFARVYRCLFWFNPLVYIAERYLQLDQELSCDEKVLVTKDRAIRRIYGETLLMSAHAPLPFEQAAYSPSFGQIKQRTYMLRHYNKSVFASFLGSLLLTLSVGVSVAYGMLGTLELEPNLVIREELRVPMEFALKVLETGDVDDEELSRTLAGLNQLETAFTEQSPSDNELAQLNDLQALLHYRLGEFDRALGLYQQVVSLTDRVPVHQARVLNTIGEIQFARGNYVDTIKALERSKNVNPVAPSADSWALRSRAFVSLQHWDQGLRYIKVAIEQAEADGDVPPENWLLSQTALQWKLGDLTGAARSLERSIEFFPEVTYEQTLMVFNDLVQEVWEPVSNEKALAQF